MDRTVERSLEDERIVVIGGDTPVGQAATRAIVDRGGEVIVTATAEESDGELAGPAAIGEMETVTGETSPVSMEKNRVQTVDLDPTDSVAVESFFTDREFDHLLCTLQSTPGGRLPEHPPETMATSIVSQFRAAFYVARYGIEHLDAGTTTFVTTNATQRPSRQCVASGIADGAIESMIRYLAVEYGPVRCNGIRIGRVDSLGFGAQTRQTIGRSLPTQRFGEPADIASAIVFLLTAEHVTGTILQVDGGDHLL